MAALEILELRIDCRRLIYRSEGQRQPAVSPLIYRVLPAELRITGPSTLDTGSAAAIRLQDWLSMKT
jgi:hypothetical protein